MNRLVYCNNCFSDSSSASSLFVTTCAHVYCQSCKEDCTRNACKMCGATCSTAALTQNMSQDVRELFKDPKHILQRALMISDFQVSQLVRLSTYLKQEVQMVRANLQTVRANLQKATELGIKYKQQAESLRKEVAALKKELAKRQQNPGNAAVKVHGASPRFLTRDFRNPPAFGETGVFPPSRQDSSSSGVFSMPNSASHKHTSLSHGFTPGRRTTAMVSPMGLTQLSSQHAYADGSQHGSQRGSVVHTTPVYERFSTAEAGAHRRSPPHSGMSMSSIFQTPSTAASRYSTGMPPVATPADISARSRAYFNPSVPVYNDRR